MKLSDTNINTTYIIQSVKEDISKRMMAYGFFIGLQIKIIKKEKTMMVVQVCNSLYAINLELANKIEVASYE
ncbi:MAG: ferrous iron transport protein A [Christensenellales bacterium]